MNGDRQEPKKPNAEQDEEPLRYKIIEPASERPIGNTGQTEPEEPLRYKVIEPVPPSPEEARAEAETLYSFRPSAEAEARKPAGKGKARIPTDKIPLPATPSSHWAERMRKFAENPTRVLAVAGLGLGILLSLILATVFWLSANPDGRYDLGWSSSSAAGLRGHLLIEWNKQLSYRLQIAPRDTSQLAAFALAVAQAPRPQAITVHLQDSEGFVLCSKQILLKYDPTTAALSATSDADSPAAIAAPGNAASSPGQPVAAADAAQLNAQEAAREKGNDLFRDETGQDGQITAIDAAGMLPCSEKAYEKAESWSFTPDFLALDEQNALLARQQDEQAEAARRLPDAGRKTRRKPAVKLLPFWMEGDDSIVAFDTSRGVIETNGDKTFFVNKSAASMDPSWQDFPVSIHYKCDRASNCILMHAGSGALRARLKR